MCSNIDRHCVTCCCWDDAQLQTSGHLSCAERVAAELAKDTAAVQLLQGRPGATISSGDVRPMESAAVNGMRKRAVLFMDAAQQPWTVLHANDLLAEVRICKCHVNTIHVHLASRRKS